ncbi:hypothetical protein [Arthrobacter koreensis]|uniref:hypothetical protein n=1 Tax=Arthrobacter koreensis TaxID=199136 RepID=UPI0038302204
METAAVRLTAEGTPLSFVYQGRTWKVAADPVRWFERTRWWEESPRMPKDQGLLIDVEVWQLQARLGRSSKSDLVTFVIVRNRNTGEWAVRSSESVPD